MHLPRLSSARTATAVAGSYLVLLCAPIALAGPERTDSAKDSAKESAATVAYTDGKGHYLTIVTKRAKGAETSFFYGDHEALYLLPIIGGGSNGDDWSYVFWEPRVKALYQAELARKAGKLTLRCEDRSATLTALDAETQAKLLASATLQPRRWQRTAYALARDDRGRYYYVDALRDTASGRDFRLFVGPLGKLRRMKMKNIVSDSEGDIFSTSSGQLRLVLDRSRAQWIRGRQRTDLVRLAPQDNRTMIYGELGVYLGERLGTPCDDL